MVPPARESQEHLPCFGNLPHDSEEEIEDTGKNSFTGICSPGADDDELFAASTPDRESIIVDHVGADELFAANIISSPDADEDDDEYVDDDDTGFEGYTCTEENLIEFSEELAAQYDYPRRSCRGRVEEPYNWIPDDVGED